MLVSASSLLDTMPLMLQNVPISNLHDAGFFIFVACRAIPIPNKVFSVGRPKGENHGYLTPYTRQLQGRTDQRRVYDETESRIASNGDLMSDLGIIIDINWS